MAVHLQRPLTLSDVVVKVKDGATTGAWQDPRRLTVLGKTRKGLKIVLNATAHPHRHSGSFPRPRASPNLLLYEPRLPRDPHHTRGVEGTVASSGANLCATGPVPKTRPWKKRCQTVVFRNTFGGPTSAVPYTTCDCPCGGLGPGPLAGEKTAVGRVAPTKIVRNRRQRRRRTLVSAGNGRRGLIFTGTRKEGPRRDETRNTPKSTLRLLTLLPPKGTFRTRPLTGATGGVRDVHPNFFMCNSLVTLF